MTGNAMDRARRRVVDLNRARILDNDPLKWMSLATRERDDEDLFSLEGIYAVLYYLSRHPATEMGITPPLHPTRISRIPAGYILVLLCQPIRTLLPIQYIAL